MYDLFKNLEEAWKYTTRIVVVFKFLSFPNTWIISASIITKGCCDDATLLLKRNIRNFQKDQNLLKISVDYFWKDCQQGFSLLRFWWSFSVTLSSAKLKKKFQQNIVYY